MFSSLDPSPFGSRDLNEDAEEFIVDWAKELPLGAPIAILIHLPSSEAIRSGEIGLGASVLRYFQTARKSMTVILRSISSMDGATSPSVSRFLRFVLSLASLRQQSSRTLLAVSSEKASSSWGGWLTGSL